MNAPPPVGRQSGSDTGDGHWVTINGAHVFIPESGMADKGLTIRDSQLKPDYQAIVNQIAKQQGFPVDRIKVKVSTPEKLAVGQRRFSIMGMEKAGKIDIYAKAGRTGLQVSGTVAHEIMHAKVFDLSRESYLFDISPAMENSDGFSMYSKSYWMRYDFDKSSYPNNNSWNDKNFKLAWNETLADIAKWQHYTDPMRREAGMRTPTKAWMDLYKRVNNDWRIYNRRNG